MTLKDVWHSTRYLGLKQSKTKLSLARVLAENVVTEPDKGQCGHFLGMSMLTPSAYTSKKIYFVGNNYSFIAINGH